jgi:hypothetical protein
MPVDSGSIASQTGAAGGLWTHTPVDWRGNETGAAVPGGWPTSPYVAVPPNGSVAGALSLAPVITAISVTGITTTGGTVNFTVNPSSSSVVQYGTTTAYGSATAPTVGAGARTAPISGLVTVTLYHYRIASTANNITSYSADGTFSTI